jgi:hypothetical protein
MDPRELLSFLRERLRNGRTSKRGKFIRPHAELSLERLEARDQPAVASTGAVISGYVFVDSNNNGVFDAGEQPIANNPIALRDGSGNTIATTTTDANGFYQFTTNQTIDTSPQTISHTLNFDSQNTNSVRTGTLPQFDPSLGQLTSVELVNAGSITSDISAENTSTTSGSTITGTVSGQLSLTGTGFEVDTSLENNAGTFTASVFDGSLDFSGASGKDFGARTASGSKSVTLTGNDMQAFIGTGSVQVTESTVATSTAAGGGNVLVGVQSNGQANVQVIYHYTPSNALQPGNYVVVQTTEPPGTIDGKDSSNGVFVPHAPGNDFIPVTLTNGVSTNNDFGELLPGSVSGVVYYDVNRDGVADGGDSSIAGSVVTLTGTDDLGNSVSLQAVSNGNGFYQFTNLRPGTYTLTQDEPTGFSDGTDNLGSLGGTVSHDQFSGIALGAGQNGVQYNFGEVVNPISAFPPPPISPPPPPVSPPPVSSPVNPPPVFSKLDFLSSSPVWRQLLGL